MAHAVTGSHQLSSFRSLCSSYSNLQDPAAGGDMLNDILGLMGAGSSTPKQKKYKKVFKGGPDPDPEEDLGPSPDRGPRLTPMLIDPEPPSTGRKMRSQDPFLRPSTQIRIRDRSGGADPSASFLRTTDSSPPPEQSVNVAEEQLQPANSPAEELTALSVDDLKHKRQRLLQLIGRITDHDQKWVNLNVKLQVVEGLIVTKLKKQGNAPPPESKREASSNSWLHTARSNQQEANQSRPDPGSDFVERRERNRDFSCLQQGVSNKQVVPRPKQNHTKIEYRRRSEDKLRKDIKSQERLGGLSVRRRSSVGFSLPGSDQRKSPFSLGTGNFDCSENKCHLCNATGRDVVNSDGIYVCKACTREQIKGCKAAAAAKEAAADEPVEILDDTSDEELEPENAQLPLPKDLPPRSNGTRQSSRLKANAQPLWHSLQGLKATFPPGKGQDSVPVEAEDLSRLAPEEMLNDAVIDFYLKVIWNELTESEKERCHFFNSHFYKKLMEKSPTEKDLSIKKKEQRHARVKRWTKNIDIFAKDFLFIPIHDALHWSLVIVCHPAGAESDQPKSCILHLDSMVGGHHTATICNAIRAYLQIEWTQKGSEARGSLPHRWASMHPSQVRVFNAETCKGKRPQLPRQDNHTDCGLFLLTYMLYFLQSLPFIITVDADNLDSLQQELYVGFLDKRWFKPVNASLLRYYLQFRILKLLRNQSNFMDGDPREDILKEKIDEYQNMSPKFVQPVEDIERRRSAGLSPTTDRDEAVARAVMRSEADDEDFVPTTRSRFVHQATIPGINWGKVSQPASVLQKGKEPAADGSMLRLRLRATVSHGDRSEQELKAAPVEDDDIDIVDEAPQVAAASPWQHSAEEDLREGLVPESADTPPLSQELQSTVDLHADDAEAHIDDAMSPAPMVGSGKRRKVIGDEETPPAKEARGSGSYSIISPQRRQDPVLYKEGEAQLDFGVVAQQDHQEPQPRLVHMAVTPLQDEDVDMCQTQDDEAVSPTISIRPRQSGNPSRYEPPSPGVMTEEGRSQPSRDPALRELARLYRDQDSPPPSPSIRVTPLSGNNKAMDGANNHAETSEERARQYSPPQQGGTPGDDYWVPRATFADLPSPEAHHADQDPWRREESREGSLPPNQSSRHQARRLRESHRVQSHGGDVITID